MGRPYRRRAVSSATLDGGNVIHRLRRWDERTEQIAGRLRRSDDDGTSGGVTDDWKISVDRQLGQLHGDVRALLNRGVLAIVALAAMIGGLYLYTNAKFDAVSQRLTAIEVQQAKADAKLDTLIERTAPRR